MNITISNAIIEAQSVRQVAERLANAPTKNGADGCEAGELSRNQLLGQHAYHYTAWTVTARLMPMISLNFKAISAPTSRRSCLVLFGLQSKTWKMKRRMRMNIH